MRTAPQSRESARTVFERRRRGRQRRVVRDPQGRDARARRRIGQRQVGHGVFDHPPGAGPRPRRRRQDSVSREGPAGASEEEMRQVRGAGIGFVFQEPMAALNPVMRVGAHIAEALMVHGLATRSDARGRAIELLRAVKIVDPENARRRLSASTVGRHAAARDDGDRASPAGRRS